MVNPLIPAARSMLTKAGRTVYKDVRGRFISATRYAELKSMESYLRSELGAPPAGKSWSQIAAKYPERFADFLEGQ